MKSPSLCSFRNRLLFSIFILSSIFISNYVFADNPVDGGFDINVTLPPQTCYAPEIYIDSTARGWHPDSLNLDISEVYGSFEDGGKYNCTKDTSTDDDFDRYILPERQNYIFDGERLFYFVLVRDRNGVGDINRTFTQVGGNSNFERTCEPIYFNNTCYNPIDLASFGINNFNSTTDQTYVCRVNPENSTSMKGKMNVSIYSLDYCNSTLVASSQTDYISFNPSATLELTNSMIHFGNVYPGTIATSNSIYLRNKGNNENSSGVIMDIYLASDDYFRDISSSNATAVCPTGNGLEYSQFSYYATKGSLNSGANDNTFSGLGRNVTRINGNCTARTDEFTPMVASSSSVVGDMCRVINWNRAGSFLTQGAEMSITFRLDVPSNCTGRFTNGNFHFIGKII